MVNPASTPLHLLQPVGQDQRKQSQSNDWQCEKTNQQSSICSGFQKGSPEAARLRYETNPEPALKAVPCNFA
jgi:hypothetical protein